MVEAVEYFLSCFPDTEVIIDPIMGDHGRYYTNFDSSYGESMRPVSYTHLQGAQRISAKGLLEEILTVNQEIRREHLNRQQNTASQYLFESLPERCV